MVSFAVVAGASPTTPGERDAYLEMLKNVARRTPAVVARYTKPKMVNGTVTLVFDKIALDAYITKKAMQYGQASKANSDRKKKEEQKARQHQLELLRTSQMHELNMIALMGVRGNPSRTGVTVSPPALDALYMDSTSIFGGPMNAVQHNPPHKNNAALGAHTQASSHRTASNGMVSLTDIFRMFDQQKQTGNGNAAPPVAPPVTAAPTNNNNFDFQNALLMGSMPMK